MSLCIGFDVFGVACASFAFIARLQSALTPRYPRSILLLAPRPSPRLRATMNASTKELTTRLKWRNQWELAHEWTGLWMSWADYVPRAISAIAGASWRSMLTNPVLLSLCILFNFKSNYCPHFPLLVFNMKTCTLRDGRTWLVPMTSRQIAKAMAGRFRCLN